MIFNTTTSLRLTGKLHAACVSSAMALLLFSLPAASQSGEWQYVASPNRDDQAQLLDVGGIANNDVWAVGRTLVQTPSLSFDEFTLAMHWDGTSWQIVETPSPEAFPGAGPDTSLRAVEAIATDDVWAGGTQKALHSVGSWVGFQTLMMHWDGSQWSIVPTPETPAGGTGASIAAIDALATDAVWAAGFRVAPELVAVARVPLVLFWDGSSWTEQPTPPLVGLGEHELRDLSVRAADDIWIVGGHSGNSTTAPPTHPYVANWDGSTWQTHQVPEPGQLTYARAVAAVGPDDVWVVGDQVSNGVRLPLLLHWDGSDWQEASINNLPGLSAALTGVTASSNGLWASGYFLSEPAPAVARRFLAHFDGSSWTAVPAAPNGPDTGWFRRITEVGSGDLWAVGHTAQSETLTERLSNPEETMIFEDDFEAGSVSGWKLMAGGS